VDTKRIREWRKVKGDMKQCEDAKTANRKRLEGRGGKVISEELERRLIQWIFVMRHQGLRVRGKMIRCKAEEVFREVEDGGKATFKASRGWLSRFMARSGLSVRRHTTAAQKTPAEMTEKMVSFVRYMERQWSNIGGKPEDIYAMDETAVWFDMMPQTTANDKGAKSISVKTTGHEKSCCTVILTANGSGKKLKPYVVFFRGSRKLKQMNENGRVSGVIATTSVNGWINDDLTVGYLQRIIGRLAFR